MLRRETDNLNIMETSQFVTSKSVGDEAVMELNDETRLYELGYKITGTSREKRWEILTTSPYAATRV